MKGVFTQARRPNLAAHVLREFWVKVMDKTPDISKEERTHAWRSLDTLAGPPLRRGSGPRLLGAGFLRRRQGVAARVLARARPPKLLADPDATLGTPAELFIIPDHYVFRMLHSQGIPLEDLGVPTVDDTPVETDHRHVWQRFCENFHLFRATPTGLWLSDELINVFGVTERPTGENAQRIYDHLQELLASPEYAPRVLFETFGVEILCTTDAATDTLEHHATLRAEGWDGRVRPTFRPDAVTDLSAPGWRE